MDFNRSSNDSRGSGRQNPDIVEDDWNFDTDDNDFSDLSDEDQSRPNDVGLTSVMECENREELTMDSAARKNYPVL